MLIGIGINVGLSLLGAGISYLLSDPDVEPYKGPWSGSPERYRPVDGDPIPVIFGTVDLAPAVVWSSEPFEVQGESSTGEGIVSNVGRLSALRMHWVVASGPIDSISEVHIKTNQKFPLTLLGEASPEDPLDLTGPSVAEGVDVKWVPQCFLGNAATDNVVNSIDARVLPGLQDSAVTGLNTGGLWGGVGFRHVTSIAGTIIGDASYYFDGGGIVETGSTPGSLRLRATRIFSRSFGESQWYAAKAASPDGYDINPIHAIREILTDQLWGSVQLDASELDDASFKAAADKMYSEGVFVSARLSATEDTERLLAQLFAVCNAAPYLEPTTGKYKISIASDDYDTEAIPRFGDADSDGHMTRQYAASHTTRMTVKYTKRYHRAPGNDADPLAPDVERIFSQTDPAGYHRFGEVELLHDYSQVYNSETASKLATRDLLQTSRPLATLGLSVPWANAYARNLRPGSPFVWGSDIAGIPEIIFRVTSIDFGAGQSSEIIIEAIEDAFAFRKALEPNVPETEWEDPTEPPEPATPRRAFQLPLWLWNQLELERNPGATISNISTAGLWPYALAAGKPNADARDFSLHVDGITRATGQKFTQFYTLANAVAQGDTTITLVEDDAGLDYGPGVVPIVLVGDELMEVTAWNPATKVATVCRGWLDTVPKFTHHTAGSSPVAVIGALYDGGTRFARSYSTDGRRVGSPVDIKALVRTTAGTLTPDDAPTDTLAMSPPRALLPLPPAHVRAALSGSDIELTWVVRDRLDAPRCDAFETPKPPNGFTYTIRVFRIAGGLPALARTVTGVSSFSWTYTAAMQSADGSTANDCIFEVWAVDGSGRESWQKYRRLFER